MTRAAAHLILSAALVLATPFVFLVFAIILDTFPSIGRYTEFTLAAAITAVLFLVAWLAIWFGQIRWTTGRVTATAAVVIGAMVPAVVIGAVMVLVLRQGRELWLLTIVGATPIWGLALMAGTALVWRENAVDRAARLQEIGAAVLTCAKCGYNLTGLSSDQCPECGQTFIKTNRPDHFSQPAC